MNCLCLCLRFWSVVGMDVVVIIDTKNQELVVFNCSFDEGKHMTIMGGR